jgi:predicted DNA-binding protein
MAKQLTWARLEPEAKERIAKLIEAFDRDESWVVREIIEIGLPLLEERAEKFQQAMSEAAA